MEGRIIKKKRQVVSAFGVVYLAGSQEQERKS